MKIYKVTSVSDKRTQIERRDGKPSLDFVTIIVAERDTRVVDGVTVVSLNQRDHKRNINLNKHGKDADGKVILVPQAHDATYFKNVVGKYVAGQKFIVKPANANERFEVDGKQVGHSTIFLFDDEMESEDSIAINCRRLSPKVVAVEAAEEVKAEAPAEPLRA